MKTTIELPKELAEFEAIYRELLIKETLELVSDIRDEYNTLKQENPSKTLEISGYLIDKYNKSIIDEVIRFRSNIEDQNIDLDTEVYIELDTDEVYDVKNPRIKQILSKNYLVIDIA